MLCSALGFETSEDWEAEVCVSCSVALKVQRTPFYTGPFNNPYTLAHLRTHTNTRARISAHLHLYASGRLSISTYGQIHLCCTLTNMYVRGCARRYDLLQDTLSMLTDPS